MVDTIEMSNAPEIPGLRFRHFQGSDDYPRMLAVIQASKDYDRVERNDTLEDIQRNYAHLVNSDPYQDMVMIEVDSEMIGYSRVEWSIQDEKAWVGSQLAFLRPEWRQRAIGTALLRSNERHLRRMATRLQAEGVLQQGLPRFSDVIIFDTETGKEILFRQQGYTAERHEFLMVRPDLENIPEAPLPDGLEVRLVLPEHYRAIWEAGAEAFRDHWGYAPPKEEHYQNWLEDRNFQPDLWRVGWDGDQVAGMVQSFINAEENVEYQRKRGWTEGICVRRSWRRRGLARALLVQSLHAIKERGMLEAALTVDTQNLSGALRLYESVGFHPVRRFSFYRKQLEGESPPRDAESAEKPEAGE